MNMPVTPHPITFTVNDTSGSALEGAKVYVRNVTKQTTSSEVTTNSSGQAVIDLANLSGDPAYETGDVILLVGYDVSSKTSAGASYTVTGASKSQTLQLFNVEHNYRVDSTSQFTSPRLKQIFVASTGTAGYVKAYAIDDGELLSWIECPANDSRFDAFGSWGKNASGGFILEIENATLKPTVTFK